MSETLNGRTMDGDRIKRGVFAYLTEAAETTIAEAETYYPIAGTFANAPLEYFSLVAGPAIQYDCTAVKWFIIHWASTVSADDGGRTAHVTVKHNGALVNSSISGTYLKTADEPQTIPGLAVVQLAKDDTIQLVCTSSTNGDKLTFTHFVTSIREFF